MPAQNVGAQFLLGSFPFQPRVCHAQETGPECLWTRFLGQVSVCPLHHLLPLALPPQLLEYLGKGKSIVDVGLAQARHPLSTRSHYFEVEIVDPGEKCYIALGLARKVGTHSGFLPGELLSSGAVGMGLRSSWGNRGAGGAGCGGRRVFTRAWLCVFAVGGYAPPMTHNQIEGPDCSTQMGLQVGWGQPAALAVKARHPCYLPCVPCNLKCLKGVGGCRGVSSPLGL